MKHYPKNKTYWKLKGIQKAVAEHYGLSVATILGKRRPDAIVVPRQVAMYLCRRITRASFPIIGNAFHRNHATILYACRMIDYEVRANAELEREVSQIRRTVRKARR